MSKVKSFKIWSRKEIDDQMFDFGVSCFRAFKRDSDSNKYGDNWKECAYSNDFFSGWVKLTKNGMVSIAVSRD